MATLQLPVITRPTPPRTGRPCVALVGNPNSGKTSVFNILTGLRAKTANFPGTTIERHLGRATIEGRPVDLLDLPGLYSMSASCPEEVVARDALLGHAPGQAKPDAVLLIVDATNLERNLFLVSQVLELGVPAVVALNMVDLAERAHLTIDPAQLAKQLGCTVVPTSARTGRGLPELRKALDCVIRGEPAPAETKVELSCNTCGACRGCAFASRFHWAERVGGSCTTQDLRCAGCGSNLRGLAGAKCPDCGRAFDAALEARKQPRGQGTDRIDRVLTHPVIGVAAFLSVMLAVFFLIFSIAQYPMDMIEWLFAAAGSAVGRVLPEGDLQNLLVQGVLGGVGGMLVFLPQICILFFFLSLLEDTGYLARAAFVMDRLMRRVGLPGKAFVPMLSAHACAIPGIMATRVIEDRRDRLVTMLVLPLMSCSARIPVYSMVIVLMFPHRPLLGAATFTGAYSLGIFAALAMALVFKRTVLRGESQPLVMELPSYKLPSLRNALLLTLDRAAVFIVKAGTVIMVVSLILWVLATYPKSEPPPEAGALQRQAQVAQAAGDETTAQTLTARADTLTAQHALAHSAAGRVGRAIEPAIRPLGFDWQIGVGIISSFAAREVIVSTLAIVYGVGADAADENPTSLYDTMRQSRRSDGSLVFTTATCMSLLVFYVLAMQCLSTQAVTRRETNSWRWPAFQLAYMTVLAYVASLLTFQALQYFGVS